MFKRCVDSGGRGDLPKIPHHEGSKEAPNVRFGPEKLGFDFLESFVVFLPIAYETLRFKTFLWVI